MLRINDTGDLVTIFLNDQSLNCDTNYGDIEASQINKNQFKKHKN